MNVKLDLHIHSARSADGCMSMDEIARRCIAQGLHGAAVCDHDTVADALPKAENFLFIPGIEISTEYGHLLGLFVTVPIVSRDLCGAVEEIHAAGGIAVLAHPFARITDETRLTPIVHLLDGVEVFNSRAERKNSRANAQAESFARAHALRRFAGSDAHLSAEIGRAVLTVDVEELSLDAVKAALLAGKAEISGKRSPARYTAKSQLIKHKRQGASLPVYAKWALFALKCHLQDLFCKGE